MAQPFTDSKRSNPPWRAHAAGARRSAGAGSAARVVVAWSSMLDTKTGRCLAPVHLELESASSPDGVRWSCRELEGARWIDAIVAARCSEVVLTARLGRDGQARQHLVLELAELLQQRLSATKPQISVRFLPTSAERGTRDTQPA